MNHKKMEKKLCNLYENLSRKLLNVRNAIASNFEAKKLADVAFDNFFFYKIPQAELAPSIWAQITVLQTTIVGISVLNLLYYTVEKFNFHEVVQFIILQWSWISGLWWRCKVYTPELDTPTSLSSKSRRKSFCHSKRDDNSI